MAGKRNYNNKKNYKRKGYTKKSNNYVSKYKKKTYRQPTKRYGSTAKSVLRNNAPLFGGVSKLIHDQFYYENGMALSGGIGSLPQQFYRANGIFDPRVATGGHQVMGFDNMMLMYEHSAVIRSKCSVTFCNVGDGPITVGIFLSPDAVGLGTITKLVENGMAVMKTIPTNLHANGVLTLSLDCDVRNYFGKKRYSDIMDDEKLTGDIATDPLEQVYYGVFGYDAHNLNTDVTVGYDITISYDTIYYEPRKMEIS